MMNSIVRIESVLVQNFKNVKNGYLHFENTRKPYRASILGLYGQNGSGKTALIDAMMLLKLALSGRVIPAKFADYIHVDAEYATLKYEFIVKNAGNDDSYTVFYEFCIRKDVDTSEQNADAVKDTAEKYKVTLFNEILSCSLTGKEQKWRMADIANTRTEDVFIPKSKYDILTGKNTALDTELLVVKKLTSASSRSFVFSGEMRRTILRNCKEKRYVFLFESLMNFGNYGLFVINTVNTGLISMNALPLAFKYDEGAHSSVGELMLSLNEPAVIPDKAVQIVRKVIKNMNVVLSKIVPNLTIDVKELDMQLLQNGESGIKIQLVSNKNGKEIPLQYESEGIKKIISILQLLIVVYNKPSITVAIDELDSGVFEYLLGELLRIISEKGEGQLIFTSHNLRPLETIDRGFIAFTTTNPENRYIRMTNVKSNNNLRNFYYRDIVLGEQSEPVYEETNSHEIAFAFREAGEISGT